MTDMSLGKAYLELAPSTKGLAPAIRKALGDAVPDARRSGDRAGDEYGKSFSSRSRGFLGNVMGGVGMGVGMKLLDGVTGAFKGIGNMAFGAGIERSLNVAGAEKKLEGLGHSAEGVETIMSNALASVKGTAFGMGDAATVAASAVAANIKPGKELERTLKLVGDTATIAGSDMGSMGAIFNKVASSGKIQGDVIAQLGDRGIPVLQFLAEEMGVTAGEVSELARKGAIDFETFQNAMEAGLGGAAQKSGETFEGAMANAKAALGRIGESFATPVLEAFTTGFQAAGPAIDAVGEALTPVAEKFGEFVAGAAPKVTAWIEGLPGKIETVSGWLGTLRDGAQSVWSLLTEGDYDGNLFGLEEDHPAIGVMLTLHDAFRAAGDWLDSTGIPAFKTFWDGLSQNLMPIVRGMADYFTGTVLPIYGQVAGVIMSVAVPAISTIGTIITRNVMPVVSQLVDFMRDRVGPVIERVWNDVLLPAFRDVAGFLNERVLPTFRTVADFISEKVAPVVMDFADRVLIPAFEGIAAIVSWAWDEVLFPVLNGLWDVIENVVGPAVVWLWDKVFAPTFDKIGDAVDWFGENWGNVWGGIQRAAAAPVNFVIDVIWNNGLRKLLNLIPGIDVGDPIPTIDVPAATSSSRSGGGGGGRPMLALQAGGFVDLPWSAHHRDPYLGITPRGAFRFEGEEFIVNREQARRHRGLLEAINAGSLPGYARGGAVRPVPGGHFGWNGGRYRSGRWHGGLDFGQSLGNPYGTPIRSMWAGTVSKALRLNRSYGHHAMVDHGGGLQTLYAHMSRLIATVGQAVQAGGVLGYLGSTGNSDGPHLHLEVRQNGRQVNPEPYLSGAARPPSDGGPFSGLSTEGMAPDGQGGLIDLLVEVPRQFREIQASLVEMGSDPWAQTFLGSAKEAIAGAARWAVDKIPGLGGLLGFLNVPGFAAGTLSAPRGLAWVGERGPELVDFRGGERVYSNAESRALTSRPHIGQVVVQMDARQIASFREFADIAEHVEQLALQHGAALQPA